MAVSSGRKCKTKYSSFGNQPVYSPNELRYESVDIYATSSQRRLLSESLTWREWICQICCCKNTTTDQHDSPMEDPSSALTGRIRRSYNIKQEPVISDPSLPILKGSRVIDDESGDVVKRVEIPKEAEKSSQSKSSYVEEFLERERGSSCTRKFGEKSFIREILSCRDTFLKSLEWCENSLTRGKKCRTLKCDNWSRCDIQGIFILPVLACVLC